jgi:hypothetical protein
MAWWLLDSVINGTLDEDYPIMSKDDDVVILGGDGDDTISLSFKPGEAATDNTISTDFPDDNVYAADTVSYNYNWWAEDGFSVTGNPSSSGIDTLNLGPTRLPGGMGYDHISLNGSDIGAGSTASFEYGFPPKPRPDLTGQSCHKYQEDKGISDLKDYVSSTYQGHYTNDNSDVQTLDLIHSVGDAESFCRSNALKYLSRYDKKGQAKRDILKAMHYCLLLYYFSGQTNETPTRGYETF